MTTPHRTLQMALDALDRAISDDRAYIRECKDAAEAIRAHLAAQPAPAEDFCYCDDDISLQMVSGGAAPEGLYGRVTLKIGDAYVNYVKAQPAPVPDGWVMPQITKSDGVCTVCAMGFTSYETGYRHATLTGHLVNWTRIVTSPAASTVPENANRADAAICVLKKIVNHFREGGRPYVSDWLKDAEDVLAAFPAQPAAPVPDALAEAVAKAIYWEWRRDAGYVPWVDGGNSLKQDDARKIARAVVSSAAPVVREPLRDDAFHAWVEEASADHPNLLERQEFRDAMYNAWINGYNTRVDEQAHGITGGSNG
jgi:hypothetical protein